jgi:hypothetical protein
MRQSKTDDGAFTEPQGTANVKHALRSGFAPPPSRDTGAERLSYAVICYAAEVFRS